jgi:hypothetical protein
VSVIGGVPVWFDREVRDTNTGLNVEVPGCVNLEGEQALAFVRSRYYEVFDGGEWISDPTGDSGRIARQQTFIRAALNRAVAQGARNPFEMQRLIEATEGEVVLDDALSLEALLDLGERFRDFNVESFEVVTLPVTTATPVRRRWGTCAPPRHSHSSPCSVARPFSPPPTRWPEWRFATAPDRRDRHLRWPRRSARKDSPWWGRPTPPDTAGQR